METERPTSQAAVDEVERNRISPASLGIVCRDLIECISPDTGISPGMQNTPERMARAWFELTSGYDQDLAELLTTFDKADDSIDYDEMVVVSPIEFFSLCEHHALPFFGVATVAYIPDKQIIGLSKIARIVNFYARRFQVQERLTSQIAQTLKESLQPVGVGVVLKATHLCMWMRGVRSQSVMTTSKLLGAIKDDPKARGEFLELARQTNLTLR